MDVLVILTLAILLAYFLRRYLKHRNFIKHLADSLDARQRYLHEGTSGQGRSKDMTLLTKYINSLIHENTELRQAQSSQMEQLEATLGNMLEGVLILDSNNRILMVNDALRNAYSQWIGNKGIVGQRLEVLFSSSKLVTVIERIKAGEAFEPAEIELIQSTERRWVRVSGARAKSDSPNSDDLILLIFYEITRRKKLEAVRREFVANVSHELRTPVTVIKGYADTLNQDFSTMPEEQKLRFLSKLKKSADRMHDLLVDLLSLAKIESTEPGSVTETVALNALIKRVLANHADRMIDHKMDLLLELSETEIELAADSIKLEQVFDNLVNNATKYTPENSLLKVGTQKKDQEVHAWVEDNGIGIPEADLPRIFERFYRVEKGRSRDQGGTGLGLSIVKRIVSLHRGTVRAENVKGGGLRISMILPIQTP